MNKTLLKKYDLSELKNEKLKRRISNDRKKKLEILKLEKTFKNTGLPIDKYSKILERNLNIKNHNVEWLQSAYNDVKRSFGNYNLLYKWIKSFSGTCGLTFIDALENNFKNQPDTDLIYLDIETTGQNKNDKIIEVSIIDDNGKTILDTLVNPRMWVPINVTRINGITNDMVKNAPTFKDVKPIINDIVIGREVVIYKSEYDLKYLSQDLKSSIKKVYCCMTRFSEFYGEWNEFFKEFKQQSLRFAAKHIRYEFNPELEIRLGEILIDLQKKLRKVFAKLKDDDDDEGL